MAFALSHCVGLTTLHPDEAVKFYAELLGMEPAPSIEGLKLQAGKLAFFLDPGQRQPAILEIITDNLHTARPLLRSFGFEEQTWHGPGKLNLVTDPFGIAWNIFEDTSDEEWPALPTSNPIVPAKIALHLHETAKAAQFYADVFQESATETPSGWTIDSNQVRLLIEPGLPHGPAFYIDLQAAPNPDQIKEFFQSKSTQVDQFGTAWKLIARPSPEKAVVESKT